MIDNPQIIYTFFQVLMIVVHDYHREVILYLGRDEHPSPYTKICGPSKIPEHHMVYVQKGGGGAEYQHFPSIPLFKK